MLDPMLFQMIYRDFQYKTMFYSHIKQHRKLLSHTEHTHIPQSLAYRKYTSLQSLMMVMMTKQEEAFS
jgi:hypothetical protein